MFTYNDDLEKKRKLAEQLAEQQRNFESYSDSDYVSKLKNAAENSNNQLNTYGDFTFSQQDMYDKLRDSLINRKKFSWDADSDNLYNIYKEKYINNAKLAMKDTMGQAASMTGGYGNTYAQSVGQQAYNAKISELNSIIPELYQLALNRYNSEGNNLRQNLSLLQSERANEYGEYGDKYSRLADAFSRNYSLYGEERAREKEANDTAYSRLVDALSVANNDYDSSYNRNYTDYRNDVSDKLAREKFDWDKYLDEQNIALQQESSKLAREKFDWDKYLDEINLSQKASNSNVRNIEPNSPIDTTSDNSKGLYTYRYIDEDGYYHFTDTNGKDVTAQKGVNPYTGQTNPDAKYGTFSNGYQPKGITIKENGKNTYYPVHRTGVEITVNGRVQEIWQLDDGSTWYWDGTDNQYHQISGATKKNNGTDKVKAAGGMKQAK